MSTKEYYQKSYPGLYREILKYEEEFKTCDSLYHATTKESASSIISEGFKTEHCGKIHGSMEIRPTEKTTYFSIRPKSNNLNTALFNDNNIVVVLAVDPRSFNTEEIYPDDAFFSGFAQEDYLKDESDCAEELNISVSEATKLIKELESKTDKEFVSFVKPLWSIYLFNQGEMSTSQNIPLSSIKRIETIEDGVILQEVTFKKQLQRNALARTWADKLGTNIERDLGTGIHGTAYLTGCNKVLKITDDASEVINSHKLIDKHNKHMVDIYEVEIFKDNFYGILQEFLDTKDAKNIFEDLMKYSDDEYCHGIETLLEDPRIAYLDLPIHLRRIYGDIKSFQDEVHKSGARSTDLTEDNIGKRKNGNYVVFDIANEEISEQEAKLGIFKIRKEKIKDKSNNANVSWG